MKKNFGTNKICLGPSTATYLRSQGQHRRHHLPTVSFMVMMIITSTTTLLMMPLLMIIITMFIPRMSPPHPLPNIPLPPPPRPMLPHPLHQPPHPPHLHALPPRHNPPPLHRPLPPCPRPRLIPNRTPRIRKHLFVNGDFAEDPFFLEEMNEFREEGDVLRDIF